jgi:hypothetical protein
MLSLPSASIPSEAFGESAEGSLAEPDFLLDSERRHRYDFEIPTDRSVCG